MKEVAQVVAAVGRDRRARSRRRSCELDELADSLAGG